MKRKNKGVRRAESLLLILFCISMAFYCCMPRPVLQAPDPEPPEQRDEELVLPPPESFAEEVTTLEIRIMMNDTAPAVADSLDTVPHNATKTDLMAKLFDLYTHVNNPNPEYAKAITLADSILQRKGGRQSALIFLNWKRILAGYLQVSASRDSLEKEMFEASKKAGTLQGFSQKKLKQIDSLTIIIGQQKQALDRLKEVDVNIEQQRRKIE